jgi:hypothetical protein
LLCSLSFPYFIAQLITPHTFRCKSCDHLYLPGSTLVLHSSYSFHLSFSSILLYKGHLNTYYSFYPGIFPLTQGLPFLTCCMDLPFFLCFWHLFYKINHVICQEGASNFPSLIFPCGTFGQELSSVSFPAGVKWFTYSEFGTKNVRKLRSATSVSLESVFLIYFFKFLCALFIVERRVLIFW